MDPPPFSRGQQLLRQRIGTGTIENWDDGYKTTSCMKMQLVFFNGNYLKNIRFQGCNHINGCIFLFLRKINNFAKKASIAKKLSKTHKSIIAQHLMQVNSICLIYQIHKFNTIIQGI